jgi:hypothetical protein
MEAGPRLISRGYFKPNTEKPFYNPFLGDLQDFGNSSDSNFTFERSEDDEDEHLCSSQPIRRPVVLSGGEIVEIVNSWRRTRRWIIFFHFMASERGCENETNQPFLAFALHRNACFRAIGASG